jgi:hypothetical protein
VKAKERLRLESKTPKGECVPKMGPGNLASVS